MPTLPCLVDTPFPPRPSLRRLRRGAFRAALASLLLAALAVPPPSAARPPSGFVAVQTLPRGGSAQPAGGELRVVRSRYFSYVLPPGWRLGEEGPFALSVQAADGQAFTSMVGNAGVPIGYPPDRYAGDLLMALRPQRLQFGPPRAARPLAGAAQAVEYDLDLVLAGVPWRGLVKVHLAPAYDSQLMVMTVAASKAPAWAGFARWLPQVSEQITAHDGATFGRRGVMQQNIANSVAYREAAQRYRDWSRANWDAVTQQRQDSVDRRAQDFRETNIGGVRSHADPFGGRPPVELPNRHAHYWTDRNGRIVATDDPTADPNVGSGVEWRRMQPVR